MKKQYIIIGIFVILALGFLLWWQASSASVGDLNIYSGEVEIKRGDKSIAGKTGNSVKAKDTFKVKDGGRASIILKDGSVIRLEAGTEMEVGELTYEGKKIKNAVFKITIGRLWSRVQLLESGSEFQVETPSVVAVVRGTSYNIDYLQATNKVYVDQNQVNVALTSNRSDSKKVNSGQLFVISDSNLQADFEKGPAPVTVEYIDDWIRFNQEEDRKLSGGSSIQTDTKAELIIGGQQENKIQAIEYNGKFIPLDQLMTEAEPPCGPHYHAKQGFVTATDGTRMNDPGPPCGFGAKDKTPVIEVLSGEVQGQSTASDSPVSPIQTSSQTTSPTTETAPAKQVTSLKLTSNVYTVKVGGGAIFTVEAAYNDGSKESAGNLVTWSQVPEIGSIKNQGFFTGVLVGTTKIRAAFAGAVSNEITMTVEAAKTLTSLTITYTKQYPTYTTYSYLPTVQFTATAYYSDDSSANVTGQTSWSVSGSAGGSINSSGLYTPATQGTATISATYQTASNSSSVTIP